MIQELLARFFQTFKTKNPVIYGVIALVLFGVFEALQNPIFSETFGTSDATNKILEILTVITLALSGTHTSELTKKK